MLSYPAEWKRGLAGASFPLRRDPPPKFGRLLSHLNDGTTGVDPMSEKLKKVEELSHFIGSCSHRMREHIRKGRASRNTAAWRKDYRLMQAHSLELAQLLHDLRLLP